MLTQEPTDSVDDSVNYYQFVGNDPVNNCDPTGLATEAAAGRWAPTPPEGIPEIFTYRYTEQEWAENRIEIGQTYAFGPYQYMAIAKTGDPESVGSWALSNVGRGLYDTLGSPIALGKALLTWSAPDFYAPRDRVNYVDVTYKLSYQHYSGIDKSQVGAMDLAWLSQHANQSVQALSAQSNQQLKYFYIEQFGIPAVAEAVGGVFQLRTAVGDVGSSLGGVGPGNVTVYRVEGTPNARIAIGENGSVAIAEDRRMLFLNFGNRKRAEMYFAEKLRKNLPGVTLKSFEVPKSFLDDLRMQAIPYKEKGNFPPGRPYIVDEKFPDQYGLWPRQVDALRKAVIQGTGRTEP